MFLLVECECKAGVLMPCCANALLYLIRAVPLAGWSEGSGVDRCFPGWNHGCWIFISDYTSCGGSGGN